MKDLTPVTREEKILDAIAEGNPVEFTPVTREEKFLVAIANGTEIDLTPATRKEYFLNKILEESSSNGAGTDSGSANQ